MGGRCFAMVTGASRGFGKGVAEELVRQIACVHRLDLILVARSESGLQNTAAAIKGIVDGLSDAKQVVVRQASVDLADMKNLEERLGKLFAGIDPGLYSRAVLVNNAGSIQPIGPADAFPSLAALKNHIDFNVTSCLWLTSQFASLFGAHGSTDCLDKTTSDEKQPVVCDAESTATAGGRSSCNGAIVQVSSLAAVKPFKFWSCYAAGKAARDMFHRVLAEEQKDLGGLRILNYAPGPMDTDMSAEVRESGFGDTFDYVDVEASAAKCVRLALGDKSFEVGAHIDFFDKEYD